MNMQPEAVQPDHEELPQLIQGLEPFYNARLDPAEDVIFATVDFFGKPHHATFVKVVQDGQGVWVATKDPNDRLEDIYQAYDAALVPVELPGLEGNWMLLIHPWGD